MKKIEIAFTVNENGCHICTSHWINPYGYPVIRKNGKTHNMSRVIYEQSHGVIPPGLVVRHTCDNPACINLSHLILGTFQENMQDKINRNRQAKGESTGTNKLTEIQALEIIKDRELTYSQLAKKFGIDPSTVSNIKRGKKWTYLNREEGVEEPTRARGQKNGSAKLTDGIVSSILADDKTSFFKLADKYGVHYTTIRNIKLRTIWKHVPMP